MNSSGTGGAGMAAAGGERFHLSESDLTTGAAAAASSSSAAASSSSTLPPILLRCPRPPQTPSDTSAGGDDEVMEGTGGGPGTKKNDEDEGDGKINTRRRRKSPVVVLVVGMAGSGKTTLMAQLYRSLSRPATEAEAEGGAETPSSSSGRRGRAEDKTEGGGGGGDADADADAPMDEGDDGGEQEPASASASAGGDERKPLGYFINLDPATRSVPFGASIDIRDTVDYREVMRQHRLGPNGAIVTSLNLFATKFDQVMALLERRSFGDNNDGGGGSGDGRPGLDYVVVDTPGQIEAFTWSASGSVFTEALASSFPTVVAFVVDTPRCAASPNTFMSNTLYACSVSFRTRLPLVVVFNKTDVVPCGFAEEWMTEYESFQEALDDSAADSGYYGSLTRSLSLVLDEFYSTLRRCGVSAATGEGVADFWRKVDEAAEEYYDEYVPDLWNRVDEQEAKKRAVARAGLRRLERDMAEKANVSGASVSEKMHR